LQLGFTNPAGPSTPPAGPNRYWDITKAPSSTSRKQVEVVKGPKFAAHVALPHCQLPHCHCHTATATLPLPHCHTATLPRTHLLRAMAACLPAGCCSSYSHRVGSVKLRRMGYRHTARRIVLPYRQCCGCVSSAVPLRAAHATPPQLQVIRRKLRLGQAVSAGSW
jgi:hypothetical protein